MESGIVVRDFFVIITTRIVISSATVVVGSIAWSEMIIQKEEE